MNLLNLTATQLDLSSILVSESLLNNVYLSDIRDEELERIINMLLQGKGSFYDTEDFNKLNDGIDRTNQTIVLNGREYPYILGKDWEGDSFKYAIALVRPKITLQCGIEYISQYDLHGYRPTYLYQGTHHDQIVTLLTTPYTQIVIPTKEEQNGPT